MNEQLGDVTSYLKMIAIVEHFLSALIRRAVQEKHGVDAAGKLVQLQDDCFYLDQGKLPLS